MHRQRLWAVTALLATVVAAPVSLAAEGCPTACPNNLFRLALTGAFTGPAAVFSKQVTDGAARAVDAFNAQGGLTVRSTGQKFEIRIIQRDDECNPDLARQHAQRLAIEDKIAFVVGPTCTAAALAASQVYAELKVLQIVPTIAATSLTARSFPHLFRVITNDQQEVAAATAFLSRQQDGRVFVAYDETPYGRTVLDALQKHPRTIDARLLSDVGQLDDLASRVRASGVQFVYVGASPDLAGKLAQRVSGPNGSVTVVSGPRILGDAFLAQAGPAIGSVRGLAAINTSAPKYASTVERMKSSGLKPDAYALYGYAAVETLIEAIQRTGTGEPDRVAATLRNSVFDTAVGNIAFDGRGDRRDPEFFPLRWAGGGISQ